MNTTAAFNAPTCALCSRRYLDVGGREEASSVWLSAHREPSGVVETVQ